MMIIPVEWPAEHYAIGSYIQSTVSDLYLPSLAIKPTDNVLDLGCGDGGYSLKLLKQYPMKSLLGVDRSHNMVALARKTAAHLPHVSFEEHDVTSMQYEEAFDFISSFWCLQWVNDHHLAFEKIYTALTPGGRFFALLPTGDDAFFQTYLALKDSHQFASLDHFISPVNYDKLKTLPNQLKDIPFKTLSIALKHQQILLPDLETYRKFIEGLPFYDGQVPPDEIKAIQKSMIDTYEKTCQEQFEGRHVFDFRIYVMTAEK
jgi:ubiquinone/menaquinone biosynthesis C-methylase UbiE